MKLGNIIGRLIPGVLASVMAFGGTTLAGEEKTATAIASWEGNGQVFQVAPGQAFFLGSFAGTIFVEDGDGTLNAGEVVCPGTIDISLDTNGQKGRGHCIITALDGGQIFGKWACEGSHLVGCVGSFEITGGTGPFEGISGGSTFVTRSAISLIVVDALEQSVTESLLGIAVWQDLTYRIP